SRLNEKPLSNSSFDDTVDVHLNEPVWNVGVCQTTDAVLVSVRLPIAWPRRRSARSVNAANLLRGEICHVSRTTGFDIFSSEMPCSHEPGLARHALNAAGTLAPAGVTKLLAIGLS